MQRHYKYENFIPQYYNITTKLIDDQVKKGLGDKTFVYYKDQHYTYKDMQNLINKVGNALHILDLPRLGQMVHEVLGLEP